MRKCTINTKRWEPNPGTSGNNWVDLPPVVGEFHQFVTETNDDGSLVTMAVVSYPDGKVATVPLAWVTLWPIDVCAVELVEAKTFDYERIETHIIETLNNMAYMFAGMCNNISNRHG